MAHPIRSINHIILCIYLAVSVAPVVSIADQKLPDLGDPSLQALSIKQEQKLGKAFYNALRANLAFVDDLLINDYLTNLGQRLVTQSDDPGRRYRFFMLDSDSINAFAGFDAHIGVNSGLILDADNESQLAGVLAHEISHVTQRHLARSIGASRNSGLITLATVLAAIVIGSQDTDAGAAALYGGIASSQQSQINFTRENEYEADRIGIGLMNKAGLNPVGMAEFFEHLQKISQGIQIEYLRTHPLSSSRITEARHRIAGLDSDRPVNSLDFQLMQARLLVLLSDSPDEVLRRQDATDEDSTKPESTRFVSEYTRAIALLKLNKARQALSILEKLATRKPHPWLHLALAEAFEQSGRDAESLALYQRLNSLYPGYLPVSIRYARSLVSNKKPAAAIPLLRQLLQTREIAIIYKTLAQAYFANRQIISALEATGNQYALKGYIPLAIQQFEMALKQPDLTRSAQQRLESRKEKLTDSLKQERSH